MIYFCHLDRYPPQNATRTSSGEQILYFSHIYMCLLGKHFGIDSLRVVSASGFANDMSQLLLAEKDEKTFTKCVNLVYNLPSLNDDDVLRAEARKQVKSFAKGEFLRLRNTFIKTI